MTNSLRGIKSRWSARTGKILALLAILLLSGSVRAQQASPRAGNVWLSGNEATPIAATDPTKPVQRGFIVNHIEPAPGGAKLTVEIFQDRLNSPVRLILQAAVYDPQAQVVTSYYGAQKSATGATTIVPIKVLSRGKSDPTLYYQKEEFFLDYKELELFFQQKSPNAAGLKIEPGLALFVKADFPTGHNWGGFDRGGTVFLPYPLDAHGNVIPHTLNPVAGQVSGQAGAGAAAAQGGLKATALDIAYPITNVMRNMFNDRTTKAGLSNDTKAQIRSRLEGEGKFQLTAVEYQHIKKHLFELAKDPAKVQALLGNEYTLTVEDRYMNRDSAGKLVLDHDGLPIPDPMVDTYYDNANKDAAKNDMAIRYRWTAGNNTGAWNFKPGIGRTDAATGIVYRPEYGVDATDDKASSIAKFADSFHPLNFFSMIRSVVAGAVPSSFLHPSVKITDTRYKFKLKHVNNLVIEISVDDVIAENLDTNHNVKGRSRFYQLEMDIDHLATASANTVNAFGGRCNYIPLIGMNLKDTPEHQLAWDNFLKALSPEAMFDGKPVMHSASDVEATSPLLLSRKADFDLAGKAITGLRDQLLPNGWTSGSQKYAFAATSLGLVSKAEASQSVRKNDKALDEAIQEMQAHQAGQPNSPSAAGAPVCNAVLTPTPKI